MGNTRASEAIASEALSSCAVSNVRERLRIRAVGARGARTRVPGRARSSTAFRDTASKPARGCNSSEVEQQANNLSVVGSNPTCRTKEPLRRVVHNEQVQRRGRLAVASRFSVWGERQRNGGL